MLRMLYDLESYYIISLLNKDLGIIVNFSIAIASQNEINMNDLLSMYDLCVRHKCIGCVVF